VAVSARVIGNPFGATRVALINVAAEISCPAAEQIIDDFVLLRVKGILFLVIHDMLPEDMGDVDLTVFYTGEVALRWLSHLYPPFWIPSQDQTDQVGF
jgi:hypothetical protein